LIQGINDVIPTGRLGTKTPVVNTNGRGIYQSFLGSLDPRIPVYCSYMYVCRELSERVLLQTCLMTTWQVN